MRYFLPIFLFFSVGFAEEASSPPPSAPYNKSYAYWTLGTPTIPLLPLFGVGYRLKQRSLGLDAHLYTAIIHGGATVSTLYFVPSEKSSQYYVGIGAGFIWSIFDSVDGDRTVKPGRVVFTLGKEYMRRGKKQRFLQMQVNCPAYTWDDKYVFTLLTFSYGIKI